jgi:hypothetical protein
MKTVLIFLALIVAVGVSVAYYLGWLNVSSDHDQGKANVTLSVDKDRSEVAGGQLETDKDKVVQKVQDLGHKVADKAQDLGNKAADKMQDLRHKVADEIAATTQKSKE